MKVQFEIPHQADDVRASILELEHRISDQLQRMFMFVPTAQIKYLNNQVPFGQKVQDSFPNMTADIMDARNVSGLIFGQLLFII